MNIDIENIEKVSDVVKVKSAFRFMDNGHPIEGVFKGVSESNHLVIFLQGAVDRSKRELPIFHRWSWAKDIPSNVLILSDPLLYRNDKLRIGWYVGAHNFDYIQKFSYFIKLLLKEIGIKKERVIFFSSSAGGYAAMAMATNIRGSLAVVNNPQTNVLNYHAGHVKDFLDVGFNGIPKDAVDDTMLFRFSLVERMKKQKFVPRIKYFQNIADKFHYNNHFLPFFNGVMSLGIDQTVEYELYCDLEAGHSPFNKEKSLEIIKSCLILN